MSLENFKNIENTENREFDSIVSPHINPYMQPGHEPHAFKSVSSHFVDYIPVIGSAKMLLEGMRGKQYGTAEKIAGWRRAVHGVTGAGFLAADLTGIGAIGSIGAKLLTKGGIRLSGGIIEKSLEKKIVSKIEAEMGSRALLEKGVVEINKLDVRGNKRVQEVEKV